MVKAKVNVLLKEQYAKQTSPRYFSCNPYRQFYVKEFAQNKFEQHSSRSQIIPIYGYSNLDDAAHYLHSVKTHLYNVATQKAPYAPI